MIQEIFLAIVQAATEFLPISSSGHLALFGNLLSAPNLFFITILHLASLFAVLVFTRKEIINLLKFSPESKKLWAYWILATIPAAIVGYFFQDFIEISLSNYLFLGIAFMSTGFVLILTKNFNENKKINLKNSFLIGLVQTLALFPGISRSGLTISSGLFLGISRERAVKFSFLLFIPLVIGAGILEIGKIYFSFSLILSFIICFLLSLLFLNLLYLVIKRGYFWMFGFYCLTVGVLCFILYLF